MTQSGRQPVESKASPEHLSQFWELGVDCWVCGALAGHYCDPAETGFHAARGDLMAALEDSLKGASR